MSEITRNPLYQLGVAETFLRRLLPGSATERQEKTLISLSENDEKKVRDTLRRVFLAQSLGVHSDLATNGDDDRQKVLNEVWGTVEKASSNLLRYWIDELIKFGSPGASSGQETSQAGSSQISRQDVLKDLICTVGQGGAIANLLRLVSETDVLFNTLDKIARTRVDSSYVDNSYIVVAQQLNPLVSKNPRDIIYSLIMYLVETKAVQKSFLEGKKLLVVDSLSTAARNYGKEIKSLAAYTGFSDVISTPDLNKYNKPFYEYRLAQNGSLSRFAAEEVSTTKNRTGVAPANRDNVWTIASTSDVARDEDGRPDGLRVSTSSSPDESFKNLTVIGFINDISNIETDHLRDNRTIEPFGYISASEGRPPNQLVNLSGKDSSALRGFSQEEFDIFLPFFTPSLPENYANSLVVAVETKEGQEPRFHILGRVVGEKKVAPTSKPISEGKTGSTARSRRKK